MIVVLDIEVPDLNILKLNNQKHFTKFWNYDKNNVFRTLKMGYCNIENLQKNKGARVI